MSKIDQITRNELDRLYTQELYTDSEIASMYDTYQVKIGRLRKKWDIPTLGKTGRMTASLPDLSDTQKQLLIGSLLGDGCLESGSSDKTVRFSETHSLTQEGYLRWKAELLGPYVSSIYETEKEGANGEMYSGYGMITKMCTQLRPYYELFYPAPARKRVFPANLSDLITPFVLAIWYMDDGSINKFHPRITFGLDEQSLQRAVMALRHLGFSPELHEHADDSCTLSFPGQDDQFFNMVEPHVPDCMGYKLPDESVRRQQDKNARLLEPETARTLYDGGMSCEAIARQYDVSSSTVWRRVYTDGEPTRMGRPRSSYSRRAAKISLGNYNTSEWSSLDEKEQDCWVQEIYDVLTKTPFPFPAPYTKSDALSAFDKLVNKDVFLTDNNEIRPRTLYGVRLCAGYFPNRFRARYRNNPSAYEAWFDEKFLRRAIRIQLKSESPVVPYRVRKAIQYQVRTPTVFRPGVARYIYQTYADPGETVWDPCAGYGGRLLGALSAGVKYIGTEVDKETVDGNVRLAKAVERQVDVTVYCQPAETFELNRPVQVVFTSPPYFDREKYSRNEKQSWVKFGDSVQAWLDGFWKPIIQTAHENLVPTGTLALNIKDLKGRGGTIALVSETIRLATEEGFKHVDTLKMPLSNLSPRGHEPILIFQK